MAISRKRVVTVEDHVPTRHTLSRIFAHEGWDTCAAATVAEGLACLDPPPDCVVLDLELPDGQGETILARIRTEGIPARIVAVVTGTIDLTCLSGLAKYRPEVLIQKPIDPGVLCRLCRSQVGE